MKRIIALLLCCVCLVMALASCADVKTDPEANSGEWGDVYTLDAAYAQAKTLGYGGSLEEFLASIKGAQGAQGIGIKSMTIRTGHLFVVLTNGTEIDVGLLPTGNDNSETVTADFSYMINATGTGLILTKAISVYSLDVVIPATVNGLPVIEIGTAAFYQMSTMRQVTIPLSVQKIGDSAFAACTALTTINFGGTRVSWGNMPKSVGWDAGAGSYTVVCSDGVYTESTNTGDSNGSDEEKHWSDTVDFNGTTIRLQLSSLPGPEFRNGSDAYMKGPDRTLDENATGATGFEKVQNEVMKRNNEAKKKLGLNVEYTYCDKDWSHVMSYIRDLETSGTDATRADMYCDMMFDMAGLSIENGIFANILKYTQTNKNKVDGWKEGAGYLRITNRNGYNVNLMEDMALTNDKQFLIASDYYMDVLRAMIVMPFNLDMYENYANSADPGAVELFNTVFEGDWTWDALAGFDNVYTGDGAATLEPGTTVLMALNCGGLSATGILYSTAFVNFETDNSGDKIVYTLDTFNAALQALFSETRDLATHRGVVCDHTTAGEPLGIVACREKFTFGEALFAGPQVLACLEEDLFLYMQSSIGVLPVPKVSTAYDYNTTVSSRARVGAIGYHSPNKKEVTAWIQYCTEKSDAVKTAYFDRIRTYRENSAAQEEMLDFIYNNMGSNKSMIIDNLIRAEQTKKDIFDGRDWILLLMEDYFTGHADDIVSVYAATVEQKQPILNDIVDAWYQSDAVTE